jgi:hypothetical protein
MYLLKMSIGLSNMSTESKFKPYLHWQSFRAIIPATATCDSHHCTCLGHLGRHDTDRIISIFFALPKVAKVSTVVTVMCLSRVDVADGFANKLRQCK